MNKNYIKLKKTELTQINISDIDYPLPDLKNISETRSNIITKWLVNWLEQDLRSGKIQVSNILPPKTDFAYMFGVSIGTIQTAYRHVEDLGYIESKQCLGSLVKDPKNNTSVMRKLTSKRELAIERIKKYIKTQGLKAGEYMPSTLTLAEIIDCSANTTRLALDSLRAIGILKTNPNYKDKTGRRIINSTDFSVEDSKEQVNLAGQIERELKKYITENLSLGDRVPSHTTLSEKLKVSMKTVHEGLRILINEGILLPRRGRYGTTVIKMPYDNSVDLKKETSIFAPAHEAAFYYYEKTQNYIKKMIAENYEVGDRLPSMQTLSAQLNLSPNTIRKAFSNLAKEGYLVFSRGRYGGTFVIDKPEIETQSFKWLAVNPQYAKVYK